MPEIALLVSLTEEADGLRFRLDDVRRDPGGKWAYELHYANKVFSREAFDAMIVDDAALANLGSLVVARLAAYLQTESHLNNGAQP